MTTEYRKTIVVDFDGVIAQYSGWRGPDHYGEPVPYVQEALDELHVWGWDIVVWTTRGDADGVRNYMREHGLYCDSVNTHDHNPPGCSSKPIAEVYVDDHGWYDVKRRFSWCRVMKRLRKLYRDPRGLDTFLDDAACWGPWWFRLFNIAWGA